jgi:dTDP-4-dehydrorhamnose reductase
MIKQILVTGSDGQLGNELQLVSADSKNKYIFTDVGTLDITKPEQLKEYLGKTHIDYLINCAAYTAVDKAETEKEKAYLINSKAVENIAASSKEFGFKLIHISTDFVFDGKKSLPYNETDAVNPLSVYGASKYDGEKAIINSLSGYLIIRTSWLYSTFGNNFVKTILNLAVKNSTVKVVADQLGTPTYALDLASLIYQITEDNIDINGIYHYSNEGVASWYDFAFEICRVADIKTKILPIESSEYPTLAARPFYSVMNKKKIKKELNIDIPHWKDALTVCMNKIHY